MEEMHWYEEQDGRRVRMHQHTCGACGHSWKHSEACADLESEHTCEKCGYVEWWKTPRTLPKGGAA